MSLSHRSPAARLAFLIPAVLVAFAPSLRGQAPEAAETLPAADTSQAETDLGESPERYAQIKVLEGDATIRKGETEEALTRGIPVGEGDVVESRGRGVLQLGDGTRIAFGPATRFQVSALFADDKGSRQVLLRLDHGRLRVHIGSQSDARVRVDSSAGTGAVADGADATFDLGNDRALRFRVHTGRTTFGNERGHTLVRAGERLTVYGNQDSLDRLNDFNTYDEDEFDHWAEPWLLARRGESATRVPREIGYYADDLDQHGKWVYVPEAETYCWSPVGVAADWRPYYDGRWAAYAGGMTWVSSEPWGYVTYHHGRWGWGASLGWYWIPGIYYSPAWVAWQSNSSYFGWAPLGYTNQPCMWGYGAWGGGHCWNVVNINYINVHNVHTRCYTDPRILQTFNHGPARVAGGPASPWFRGRMMVTAHEFRDPIQVQRLASQRDLGRTRLMSYDQSSRAATGRMLVRPEAPPERNSGPRAAAPPMRGFESQRPRAIERPILREQPVGRGTTQAPGQPNQGPRMEERPRTQPRPDDRRTEPQRERPRAEEPRPVQRPEERRVEPQRDRPRVEEPRQAPRQEMRMPSREIRETPRETPRESPRQAPRETPREAPREAPRQESRPAAKEAPRRESRSGR